MTNATYYIHGGGGGGGHVYWNYGVWVQDPKETSCFS